ncbi:MAG: hypothetical protein JNJ65_00785 [Cyclobacteriaceae bacterium]|nr:hypothetical protein [Cyclobacteriaceae bacterium]
MATKGISNISISARMRQLLVLVTLVLIGMLIALSMADAAPTETEYRSEPAAVSSSRL